MENLNQIIPIKASSYFYELPIYAWNSDVNKPFKAPPDNIILL